MRYWCISTSAENWEICRRNCVWGMDARYFVIVDEFFYEEKELGWTKNKRKFLFPYRIKFNIIHEARNPILISFSTEEINNKAQWNKPNFIDEIIFIADKGRTWDQYLQVSIISITKEDFETISKAIKEN